jgi:hypothetical protein
MDKPKVAFGVTNSGQPIPKDKKRMILAVCQKYGIATSYYSKVEKRNIEVTEEGLDEFHNIDLLLCTKDALTKLLTAELAEE